MYRRKLRHSRVKNLYKFASFKTASAHTVESSPEFDACYHFEYSPQVKSFIAQPIGFTYSIHGKTNPYTPDFKIINNKNSLNTNNINSKYNYTVLLLLIFVYTCKYDLTV